MDRTSTVVVVGNASLVPTLDVAQNLAFGLRLIALIIYILAAASDWLDGYLARAWNQYSPLGRMLDPIADKLLMTTAFVILTLPKAFEPTRHLPVPFWVTASVIGRDVLITASAIAIFIITDFRGFKPSWLGKLSTLVQVSAVILILFAAIFPMLNVYLPTVYTSVVAVAVFSGVHYIFHVARLMNEDQKKTISEV